MLTYNDFCSLVKELNSVESITGKVVYKEINVQGDFVSFRRENNEKPEIISLEEMYKFMCEQPIDNITTANAKKYIHGHVQSPAVAIIKKVYNSRHRKFERNKKYKKIGCIAIVIALFVGIVVASFNDEDLPIDAYNAPCVVNTDDIVVYDSEYLDKVTELIYNRDEAALNYLIGVGICSYVKKGTKGIYVRYLHDDYVVVKFNGDIRPAIIPRSHISKQ